MKIKLLALILAFTALPTFAGSGSIGVTSDYIWRGVSQTSGSSAIQMGYELESNGLFGGVWGSQVDFGADDDATLEYDFYGGYKLDISDKVSVAIGAIQYNWDKGYDDVEEAFLKVDVGMFSVGHYVTLGDSDKDFTSLGMRLPFIKFADVSVEHGRHDEDNDFTALRVSKEFKNVVVDMFVMSEARQGQFMDHAAFSVNYKF